MSAAIGWAGNATGYRIAQLFLGAVGSGTAIAWDIRPGIAVQPNVPQFSRIIRASATNVIHLRAYQTIGATTNTLADPQYCYMQIEYVGP